MTYTLNFYNMIQLLESLKQIYKIENIKFPKEESELTSSLVEQFILENNINLLNDVSNIKVKCRHFSTIIKKNNTIQKMGLLPLGKALELETDLRKFLEENNIRILVDEKKLLYKGNSLNIDRNLKQCNDCIFKIDCYKIIENDIFGSSDKTNCDYDKLIEKLYKAIYVDKGEIEGFIYKKNSFNIDNYSDISKYPEILLKIENVIKRRFDEQFSLIKNWHVHKKVYIDFEKNILDFKDTTINTNIVSEVLSIYKEKNYSSHELRNIKYNIFIIQYVLNSYLCKSDKIFQLKDNIQVLPDELKMYNCY